MNCCVVTCKAIIRRAQVDCSKASKYIQNGPHLKWRGAFHSIWNAPSLQGVHGLHEYPGLPVDEAHVLDDLLLGVEQLDALRVRVVARREGPRVRRREFPAKNDTKKQ